LAHAEWYEASSQHFVVYSDDDPERVKAFASRLERFDKALRVLREVPNIQRGPSARVTVYVVGSVADVQRIYPGRGNDVAGFYQPRSSGPVAFVPRRGGSFDIGAQRILLHEYGHHFMFNDWPTGVFPKWFIEGFAEFNSTAIFNDDGSITFGAKPLDRAFCVGLGNQLPLPLMLQTDPGKLDNWETCALYSRGWLLTHFLTFDPERRKQLGSYIADINAGKPIKEATKVFGNLSSLELKLNNYAKRATLQTWTIPADQIKIGDVKLRKLGAGEAATMPARLRSSAGVDEKSAPEVAALARKLAAPFPNDAAAQNELAEAEYDAKNYAQAEAAADRALAADPKSVHAALYKGMALQAVAEKDKSTDPARWQAIRRWYSAANKMDPENPEPLILYYRSFKPAKQTPTKNADAGLLYAYALAPYDLGLRIEAARVYLQQGKGEDARKAMVPVAFNERAGDYAALVRAVVETLDKSGAAAALAELDKRTEEAKAKAEAKAKKD
jgi:tetratricopeptide (TPR) repeat protein